MGNGAAALLFWGLVKALGGYVGAGGWCLPLLCSPCPLAPGMAAVMVLFSCGGLSESSEGGL